MKSGLLAVLVLLLAPVLVSAVDSSDEYVTLFFDDLDTENPHWDYNAPKPSTHILRDGYVFLNVTGTEISGFHELKADRWLYTGIEMRLRQGSLQTYRPCGYYTTANRLRFCYLDSKSSPFAQGLHAESMVDGKNVLWEPIEGIDIRDWHTYTVIWEENNGTFLIDGEVVAHTDQVPTQRMEIWIYILQDQMRLQADIDTPPFDTSE